jgi:hypothetical protein
MIKKVPKGLNCYFQEVRTSGDIGDIQRGTGTTKKDKLNLREGTI